MEKTQKLGQNASLVKAILMPVIALLIMLCMTACGSDGVYAYDKAVENGYTGSEEEFVAALIGEEVSPYDEEKSAYELACENGYAESEETWIEDIIGEGAADTDMSVFRNACENGYEGSLAEWVDSLCENPEKLGISAYGEEKTDYEYACEYGYEGTFAEWLAGQVSSILVCPGKKLIYRMTDGTEKEVIWKDRSRRKSWTPEMKEKARQKALLQRGDNTCQE